MIILHTDLVPLVGIVLEPLTGIAPHPPRWVVDQTRENGGKVVGVEEARGDSQRDVLAVLADVAHDSDTLQGNVKCDLEKVPRFRRK